ncbi:hypothetical protein [Williamsia sp. CHRR-6]|nr:hypothetical protein [Williamsia sp. CHRR-6]
MTPDDQPLTTDLEDAIAHGLAARDRANVNDAAIRGNAAYLAGLD